MTKKKPLLQGYDTADLLDEHLEGLGDLLWASDQALHEFDHDLALRLADRAVAMEDSVGAHLARGSALSAMGRAADAEQAFDLAIAAAPDEDGFLLGSKGPEGAMSHEP